MMSKSSVAVGDSLEIAIRDLLESEIAAGRFWAKRANCKIFRKKGYYSKDRASKIVFDVSIEVYLPKATEYSMLVLVECKNHKRTVEVGEVEEFYAKVQQVAAAGGKAVVASTASFDRGSQAFAKSKGMGLIRYFDSSNFKWELRRSSSASARGTDASEAAFVEEGISREDFRSTAFDLYLQSPTRLTNSLWDFVEDLAFDAGLTAAQIGRIANRKAKLSSQVPFIEKDLIEAQAADVLSEIAYSRGPVLLDAICALETRRSGLLVETGVVPLARTLGAPVLGRLRFQPLQIQVFAQAEPNPGRERFTLAHELAHHLLRHGQFMTEEACDEQDFVLNRRGVPRGTDIARMEFQANYFASCLLMPRVVFIEDFVRVMRSLDLVDRGFGALYVDNQPCNLQSYERATGRLMDKYGVSRAAVKIRLEGLGLLRDDRSVRGLRAIQAALTADDILGAAGVTDADLTWSAHV